jgi:hypothetical protein
VPSDCTQSDGKCDDKNQQNGTPNDPANPQAVATSQGGTQ